MKMNERRINDFSVKNLFVKSLTALQPYLQQTTNPSFKCNYAQN